MTNDYYDEICKFCANLKLRIEAIFQASNNELHLNLEGYNLLTRDDNCIKSSTAVGYLLEEFVISKLQDSSHKHYNPNYAISRAGALTTKSSFDCISDLQYTDSKGKSQNIRALINIKADKSNNNAIAAINRLYEDYTSSPEQTKCYIVVKIRYSIKNSKIIIEGIETYSLEEIDFAAGGSKTDHRSWSKEYNPNSGRLQATTKFRKSHKVSAAKVSYTRTLKMIRNMYVDKKSS